MENKKSLIALALVALVGVVGATFAYFTSSAKLTNEFETGTYSTSVTEEFVSPDNWTPGTTTTKKVNVTNNGSVDVVARATYTETWKAKDGTVLTGVRNSGKVAQFTIGSDWIEGTDGYYYYKYKLENGETSSDFISEVTFNPNFELEEGTDITCTTTKENGKTTVNCSNLESGYAGATYTLEITIETIQADQKWIAYENAYYYNGVELPQLVNSDEFKFRGIGTMGEYYALCEATEVPKYGYFKGEAVNPNNGVSASYDGYTLIWDDTGNVDLKVQFYLLMKDTWVLYDSYDYSDSTSNSRHIVTVPFVSIWSNKNILYEDGSVYMEGTGPMVTQKIIVYGEQ